MRYEYFYLTWNTLAVLGESLCTVKLNSGQDLVSTIILTCNTIQQGDGWRIRLCVNVTRRQQLKSACRVQARESLVLSVYMKRRQKKKLHTLTKPTVTACKTANNSSIPMLIHTEDEKPLKKTKKQQLMSQENKSNTGSETIAFVHKA